MCDSYGSRRKFFLHPAHKAIGVSAGLTALRAFEPADGPAATEGAERPVRVCLVSGSLSCNSGRLLAEFGRQIQRHYNVECSRAFGEASDDLPGLENLDGCDCMLLLVRRMTVGGEQLRRIQEYCRGGGAVVGVRTASHAFANWPAMDRELFGGDYRGQYNNRRTGVQVVEAAKGHPAIAGVEPFVSHGGLYKNPAIAEDTTLLLSGTADGHTQPAAWTRLHHGGRVFYTSLGHTDDFREPNFVRLLLGAISWTCGGCCRG